MSVRTEFANGLLYLWTGTDLNNLCRTAGMAWLKELQAWATPFSSVAAKVIPKSDRRAYDDLLALRLYEERCVVASTSTSFGSDPPAPRGLTFRGYQSAGVAAMLWRESVLLADPMGVGKTIQVIGLLNLILPESVLVICPAAVKLNWASELRKWLTLDADIDVLYAKGTPLGRRITIVNYDILHKFGEFLKSRTFDVLVLDEAQYLKNKKARRTREVLGGRTRLKTTGEISESTAPIRAVRKLALTGTPLENRPIELYPILNYLLPEGFPTVSRFEKRYCDLKQVHGRWDNSGASNLDELQLRLRGSIMIRRSKEEVLRDLPPKMRQVIELVATDGKLRKALKAEASLPGIDAFKARIRSLRGYADLSGGQALATVRRETGLAKVGLVGDHLADALEGGAEKVICFCYHRAVAEELSLRFARESVVVTGGATVGHRERAIGAFQTDPDTRLFIGNIDAAGIGITLTAAPLVVFAEMSWVVSRNLQAEDRAHRIGQERPVLVQYLVWADSLDAYVANTMVSKADVLAGVLDNDYLL